MLKQILDQASNALQKSPAQQWELMLHQTRNISISIKDNELEKLQESESLGLGLRVVQNQRLGFSYLMGSDLSRLAQTINAALASAQASDPVPGLDLAGPAALPAPDLKLLDNPHETVEDKIERGRQMAAAALKASPKVSHVYPADISQSIGHTLLRTSQGFDGAYEDSVMWAGCAAIAEDNGQQEEAYEGRSARSWQEIDIAALGAKAGGQAAGGLGATAAPGGQYMALFTNEVTAYFLGLLAFSMKADNLSKGRSQLSGKQGKKLFAPIINLIDNPLLAGAVGSRPFDDEGTPSRATPLVKDGIYLDFIRDRYWAQRLNLASTGNSHRNGLKSPPEVGFSNLILAPGRPSMPQLIAQMSRGIIVEQVLGGHTADPVSGQFSLGLAGQLVENGQIVRPVRGNALAGQIFKMFAEVRELGNDLQSFGQVAAPCMLVPELTISGPAA